ncbi:MAG: hypothetical protein ACM3SY_12290 [Candidatus Omnitrophota bacterium]
MTNSNLKTYDYLPGVKHLDYFRNPQTGRFEFPFLNVSAAVDTESRLLTLVDENKRTYHFRFLNYQTLVDEAKPNTLYLDTGNNFCKGVLDHHHTESEPEKRWLIRNHSAATLLLTYPEMVTNNLHYTGAITINLHINPDFDTTVSVYLALYYITQRRFPIGAKFIADYAKELEAGSTPFIEEFGLATNPNTIMYMAGKIIRRHLPTAEDNIMDTSSRKALRNSFLLLSSLAILETIFDEFERRHMDDDDKPIAFYNVIDKLFRRDEWKFVTSKIENDYHLYVKDIERAEKYIATLEYDDVIDAVKLLNNWAETEPRNPHLLTLLEKKIPKISNVFDQQLQMVFSRIVNKIEESAVTGNAQDAKELQELGERIIRKIREFQGNVPPSSPKPRIKLSNADMIAIENPQSVLFKEWARRDKQHCSQELKINGFDVIFSIYTRSEGSYRYIISVNPKANLSLKFLSQKLEEEEKKIRQFMHLPRLGDKNRPGYDNPDPWFDGRGTLMEYTMVDTPGNGTLLDKERVIKIVYDTLKARESIFSGNLCFIGKVHRIEDRFLVKENAAESESGIGIRHFETFFYRQVYRLLSAGYKSIDISNLKPDLNEFEEDDVRVRLNNVRVLTHSGTRKNKENKTVSSPGIICIDCEITSASGLKLILMSDKRIDKISKQINEKINKPIYEGFGVSVDKKMPDQHMIRFFKTGEGKQFYQAKEATPLETIAFEILQQKSTFSIPKVLYTEFYEIVKLITMLAFHLKQFLVDINRRIEEFMQDKKIDLDEVEDLRKSLISFLSHDYKIEITPSARYALIWKNFLEKFDIQTYIDEAKWQSTEISNYYMEVQSFRTGKGVAVLTWIIAPMTLTLGFLTLDTSKSTCIHIGSYAFKTMYFWPFVIFLLSVVSYIVIPRFSAFLKRLYRKHLRPLKKKFRLNGRIKNS